MCILSASFSHQRFLFKWKKVWYIHRYEFDYDTTMPKIPLATTPVALLYGAVRGETTNLSCEIWCCRGQYGLPQLYDIDMSRAMFWCAWISRRTYCLWRRGQVKHDLLVITNLDYIHSCKNWKQSFESLYLSYLTLRQSLAKWCSVLRFVWKDGDWLLTQRNT